MPEMCCLLKARERFQACAPVAYCCCISIVFVIIEACLAIYICPDGDLFVVKINEEN